MARSLGRWVLAVDGGEPPAREVIGGKAWSIAQMQAHGLNVPPAIVITTHACRAFLARQAYPEGLEAEIADGIAWLEQCTARRFGGGDAPLLVAVRSGAPVSMPRMMDTVLNLGLTERSESSLAAECGDAAFARDTHRPFLSLYAPILLK